MEYMKSSVIINKMDGVYAADETDGRSLIFGDAQFFLAKDGTWLMVDWIDTTQLWYVTEGV